MKIYIYVFTAKSGVNLIMMKYRNCIKIKTKCSVYQPSLLCMIIPRRTK